MKVLMLSADKNILKEGSRPYLRMLDYGGLFEELYIVVFAKGDAVVIKKDNISIYSPGGLFKIFSMFGGYILCVDILKRTGEGIITSQDGILNFLAFFLKKRFRLKLQIQIHTDFFDRYFRNSSITNQISYFGYLLGIKNAECIRVVSNKIKDTLIRKFKIDKEKIAVLPIISYLNSVDTKDTSIDLHKKYPQFTKIILIVSRLEYEKNIYLAIRTLREINKEDKNVGMVVCGSGSELESLKKYSEKLGVSKNIVFLGWVENILPYYKTADCLVVTSYFEGYGMTIVEALSLGIPVVSCDVGIAKEAGAIISDRNPEDFSKKIIFALEENTGVKLNIPIFNKEEYLKSYKESFNKCL